jgi:hypothetical protein
VNSRGDGTSTLRCGALEILIPGDERGVSAERERAREVDGVVSAQFVLLGKLARSPHERTVDPDQHQLTLQRLELLARPTVPRGAQPSATTGGSERRATLGVAQDAGCRPKPRAPQLGHQFGVELDNDELDQRRDVLLPALLGGLGGIVVLTMCSAIWGYCATSRLVAIAPGRR